VEVNDEMTEFDDIFKDLWDDDFLREFMTRQRKMQKGFMEQIKRLQEAAKSGKLQGRTEVTPIEKPGVKGYIFHGIFGTPGAFEGEEGVPELDSETKKNEQSFAIPETGKEELREPVVERFTAANEFVAVVELPGVEEQDITVVPRETSIKVEAFNFKTVEVDLPPNADITKMTKTLKNGVLEVRVPLTPPRVEDDVKFGVA
jgi:HSP20 family molecular chaperone IbpA